MDNIVVKFELKIAMGYFLLKMYNNYWVFFVFILRRHLHKLDTASIQDVLRIFFRVK